MYNWMLESKFSCITILLLFLRVPLLSSNLVAMFVKFLGVLVAVNLVLVVQAIEEDAKNLKCKGHDIDIGEEEMAVIVECAMDLGITSKEQMTKEKIPCFSKCLLEKKELIDHDGGLHIDKINNLMDKSWPPAIMEDAKKHLMSCIDQHASKIKPKDETCLSFEPLTSCIHKAFLDLCVVS